MDLPSYHYWTLGIWPSQPVRKHNAYGLLLQMSFEDDGNGG